ALAQGPEEEHARDGQRGVGAGAARAPLDVAHVQLRDLHLAVLEQPGRGARSAEQRLEREPVRTPEIRDSRRGTTDRDDRRLALPRGDRGAAPLPRVVGQAADRAYLNRIGVRGPREALAAPEHLVDAPRTRSAPA